MPSEIKFNNGTQYKMVFCNRLFYSNDKKDLLNSTSKTMSTIIFDPADYNVDLSVNKTTAVAGEGITLTANPTSKMKNMEYAFLYRPKGTTQWIVYRNYEESNTCIFRLPQSSIGTSSKSYEFLVKAKSKIETNGDENTTNGLVVTDIRVGDDAVNIKPNTTKPGLTVTGNPTSWTNQTVNLKINVSDSSGAGIKKLIVNGKEEISLTNGSAVYTVNSYGQYSFEAINYAENSTTANVAVKIDKEAPTTNKPSANVTGNTITVTAKQEDKMSGIKLLEYSIYKENEWGEWQKSNIFSGLKVGTTYKVKTKATDNAGNYIESEELVIKTSPDEIQPELKVSRNAKEWTNKDITLTIQASDNESGLKNVTVNGKEIKITEGEGKYLVKENGTYRIIATDNAGNTKTEDVVVNKIDKILPSMVKPEIVLNNNNITVINKQEDKESGILKVTYSIYQEGKWSEYQDSNRFEGLKEGKEYRVKTIAVDKAGNISESEEAIVKIIGIVIGDINNDKKIDTMDLLKLLRYVTMQNTGKNTDKWNLTDEEKKAADINKDGKVNIIDVLKMKRYIAASKDKNIVQKHPSWLEI